MTKKKKRKGRHKGAAIIAERRREEVSRLRAQYEAEQIDREKSLLECLKQETTNENQKELKKRVLIVGDGHVGRPTHTIIELMDIAANFPLITPIDDVIAKLDKSKQIIETNYVIKTND